jgi:hypothetical protein
LIIVAGADCVVVAGIGSRGPFRFELLKNSLDAVAPFNRLVVEERELWDTLQAKTLPDLAAQEWCRAIEGARRLSLRLVIPDGGVIDARLLQIWRQFYLGDRQEPDAGIVNLARKQRRKLRLNLIADAGRSGVNHVER